MPTYEYACRACGHEFERFQPITAGPIRKCPECGKAKVERKIGIGAGVLFRGGGFYETDYRSESYTKSAEAEKKAREPAAATSDAKPAKPDAGAKDGKRGAAGDEMPGATATSKATSAEPTSASTAGRDAGAARSRASAEASESKATHRSRIGRGIGNIVQRPPKPSGGATRSSPRPKSAKKRGR